MSNVVVLRNTDLDEVREGIAYWIEATSEWRMRKAKEYPDDSRNIEAALILDKMKSTVNDIPAHLLLSFAREYEREQEEGPTGYYDAISEELRAIGFYSGFISAQRFVEYVLFRLR